MSNTDLLSEHERAEAAAQGWTVCDVFDAFRTRVVRMILPLEFKAPYDTADKASRWVIQRARKGDKLALRAVQLVMQGNRT